MPLGRRQRRILLALAGLVGGLLVLWFSAPLWFPWVLGPLARRAGAQYARYRRTGYGQFVLDEFTYTNRSVRLTARKVEALTPTEWLWRLGVGRRKTARPFLTIDDWRLEPVSGRKGTGATSPTSAYAEVQKLSGEFRFLRHWVPIAALSNGTVEVQNTVLKLPLVTWAEGRVWGEVGIPKFNQQAVVSAQINGFARYDVQIQSRSFHLDSQLLLSTNAAGMTLRATNLWWNQPIMLEAQFGRTGSLPEQAVLQAPHFQFPASLAQLPHYRYVTGSLAARWEHGRFTVALAATAQPQPAQTNLPPVDVALHARGDTKEATIETASIDSPWLRAELSRGLAVHFQGPLLRAPAQLSLAVDLNRQSWLPLKGNLKGTVELSPATGKLPAARFQLSGSGVGVPKLLTRTLEIGGALHWPWLTLTNLHAQFDDRSIVSLSAELGVTNKLLRAGHVTFAGPLARRWLPKGYSYQDLAVAAEFSGPLTNLNHSGHLRATNVTSPDLRPLELALEWTGRQENLTHVAMTVSSDRDSLSLAGALALAPTGGKLRLNDLTLRRNGGTVAALSGPARVSFELAAGARAAWTARVESFHWAGSGGELSVDGAVDWPSRGTLKVSARNLQSALLQDFLKHSPEPVALNELNFSAAWTNAPVEFGLRLSAVDRQQIPVAVQLEMTGNAQGLALESLNVTSAAKPIVTAKGVVPLTLTPASPLGLVQIRSNAPVHLEAMARPHAVLWDKVATVTGVRLREPHLNLEVNGTLRQPKGQVHFQAQQIEFLKSAQPMPSLKGLRVELEVTRQLARLVEARLLVQNQPVSATGELPLGDNAWADLAQKRPPELKQARGRVQMDHVSLAAFSELYPSLLSPQGELNLDVSLQPGFKVTGQLAIHNARTRPLASLGPIRDIAVEMKLKEHLLVLQSASANIGGAPVHVSGLAQVSRTNFLKRELPPFSFTVSGTNVPVVRKPEAIVRADLLLAITKTNGAPPQLSGLVNLRDSYFLSDLAALIPGKIATPRERPPYFSITNSLLADWRLAVHVTGDRFLKVRTTLFNGEVSANFQLQGTLKNPEALGDARIASGVVSFPFGSLQIQYGFISITAQNPYRPQLSLTATSEQFGYNIKMQVTGAVDAPVVEFSSTPPLSSEQILLLLTTGQMPQGNFTLNPQQRAQTLAVFLARDVLAKLGFGSVGESRLKITSGQEISVTGKPTYTIEFKLTKNWSLVAEYDRFGDYNAGVEWRVYSK